MSTRTHISYLQFECAAGHKFSMPCKQVARHNATGVSEFERVYQRGEGNWLPVAKCPVDGCPLIGEEVGGEERRTFAQVPEAERFYAWLSPDGERVSVPGYRGARMPERYRRAGYVAVEASNLHDLDRLQSVRARQTGNDVYHEASFDRPTRAAREVAEYSEDLTVDT